MIVGIIMGLMVGLLGIPIGYLIYECSCSTDDVLKGWISGVLFAAVFIFFGGFLGNYINTADVESYTEQYKVTSETYYSSIDNEKLSGLERLELTQSVMLYNRELANRKVDMVKFWSIGIPKSVKEEVLKLEYIE